mmetsp:Transcript_78310/g.227154  ORF Transcript_78310/g.227154 Transcript_78310/m.227154 type:complete len:408 (-) Transcript_78310:125-1348(-)
MPKVQAYIYDITQGMASRLSMAMLGKQIDVIPHTGIVVFGREYFFGSGPCTGEPGKSIPCEVHQILDLGDTEKTAEELDAHIQRVLVLEHTAENYNLLSHNCNHYADDVAKFLLNGRGLPPEIVHIAEEALSTPRGQALRAIIENFERQMRGGGGGASSGLNPFGDIGGGVPRAFAAPSAAAPPSAPVAVSPELEDAIQEILRNPLEVRRTCLQTLLKITENVEKNPGEAKFRRIKMENAVFVKKVAGCDGGTEALLAAGWVPSTHDAEDVWFMDDVTATRQSGARQRFAAELAKLPAENPAQRQAAPAPAPAAGAGFGSSPFGAAPGNLGGLGAGFGGLPGGMNPQMLAQAQQMMQNNPQMMSQAQQMMQNPQMMAQVQQMMQNPQMMAQMQQMMGGQNGMGGGGF